MRRELIEIVRLLLDDKPALLVIVVLALSLVQVSKIQINPWDTIFGWFGQKINGGMLKRLSDLEDKVDDVQKEMIDRAVTDTRWHILNFAYTCRKGDSHTKEQWSHVLNQAKKYEIYVREHNISNGVIEEDTKYIRELYNELSKQGKIK